MKKVVIAGSAKLQKEVNNWLKIFESKNYEVLDYPKAIEKEEFMKLYPNVHVDFLFIRNFLIRTVKKRILIYSKKNL